MRRSDPSRLERCAQAGSEAFVLPNQLFRIWSSRPPAAWSCAVVVSPQGRVVQAGQELSWSVTREWSWLASYAKARSWRIQALGGVR